jgi:hypothetical protein
MIPPGQEIKQPILRRISGAKCGVSQSTVLRAIKSGKITGTENANGDWEVEPVELLRHFKPASAERITAQQAVHRDALIAELRAMIADLRQDRDAWRAQAVARLFKNLARLCKNLD